MAKTSPTRKTNAAPEPPVEARFAPVAAAFRRDADVSAGVMMSAYGLKVHGKIFAMFPRGVFVAKLPKARVDELVRDGKGGYFDPGHGRLMKQWIAMPAHDDLWVGLAREARRFVASAAKS